MGRHADTSRKRGFHVPIGVISIVIVLACAVGLGIWWWSLKSATDPIDANPVDAYGVVVSSPACPAGGSTIVTVSGTNPPVKATLDACGYRVGEQLPIQYLAGHPETVRLAGTSTAGTHSLAARLLPIGILAAGLIAVLATIALLIDRRRSRHQVAPTPRRAVRVPARAAAAAGSAAPATRSGVDATASVVEGSGAAGQQAAPAAGVADSQDAVFSEEGYGSGRQDAVQALESSVVMDAGALFTHANPEPPEPAGAPVELTGDEVERG